MTDGRIRWLLLAAALGLGALVVFVGFNPVPHSGGDNAGYLGLAHGLLADGTYTDAFDPERLPHTKYPPVFPLILAVLMGLGARSWVAFKLVASVATVAAVGFTYLWADRRLGSTTAFVIACLLAVSSAVVYYSHWILSDPVFLAFTLAALFALQRAQEDEAGPHWLALGVGLALLAFFTRSAGLPLVVAILVWLGLDRRWRALALAAGAIGLPALAWWWRGRGVGVAAYGAEFWLVDPYQPTLGTIGILGLVPRVFDNLTAYTLLHGPAGIVGQGVQGTALLGVVLVVAAVGGWFLSAREKIGVAELFFPLYAGLILLWPAVWAGDRFALPLYPLVLLYGAVAVRAVAARLPAMAGSLVAAAAVLLLLLPAGKAWIDGARQASACARVASQGGPFACYGPQVGVFAEAASWTGHALPDGAVVLSRKPRYYYLLSGLPSRTFAFDDDPAAQLELADAVGARYVLLDQWDGLASRYVGGAVRRAPGSFCFVRGFGEPTGAGAQLLGIRAPAERVRAAEAATGEGVRVEPCPASYVRPGAAERYSSSSGIPLLDRPAS